MQRRKKKERERINRILGELNTQRGKSNEERVVEAFMGGGFQRPSWLRNIYLASRELDQLGADVVVETTMGICYIQVKSSVAGIRKFLNSQRTIPVLPMKVDPLYTDEQIRNKVIDIVETLLSRKVDVQYRRRALQEPQYL